MQQLSRLEIAFAANGTLTISVLSTLAHLIGCAEDEWAVRGVLHSTLSSRPPDGDSISRSVIIDGTAAKEDFLAAGFW